MLPNCVPKSLVMMRAENKLEIRARKTIGFSTGLVNTCCVCTLWEKAYALGSRKSEAGLQPRLKIIQLLLNVFVQENVTRINESTITVLCSNFSNHTLVLCSIAGNRMHQKASTDDNLLIVQWSFVFSFSLLIPFFLLNCIQKLANIIPHQFRISFMVILVFVCVQFWHAY